MAGAPEDQVEATINGLDCRSLVKRWKTPFTKLEVLFGLSRLCVYNKMVLYLSWCSIWSYLYLLHSVQLVTPPHQMKQA